jgi:hypothetical protein
MLPAVVVIVRMGMVVMACHGWLSRKNVPVNGSENPGRKPVE